MKSPAMTFDSASFAAKPIVSPTTPRLVSTEVVLIPSCPSAMTPAMMKIVPRATLNKNDCAVESMVWRDTRVRPARWTPFQMSQPAIMMTIATPTCGRMVAAHSAKRVGFSCSPSFVRNRSIPTS